MSFGRRVVLPAVKDSLLYLGARAPRRLHDALVSAEDYLDLGRWFRERDFSPPKYANRSLLFEALATGFANDRVLYLEFGVAAGVSIRQWSTLLRNPRTELHGFDSFEGLPEDWITGRPAGHFGQAGVPPSIDDDRVRFHVGWFQETLPRFVWPSDWDRLVVNLDADLYSSTIEALTFVEPHIRPGSVLYFDEFNHRHDERKAFDEFLDRTGHLVRPLGATRGGAKVAFEIDGR